MIRLSHINRRLWMFKMFGPNKEQRDTELKPESRDSSVCCFLHGPGNKSIFTSDLRPETKGPVHCDPLTPGLQSDHHRNWSESIDTESVDSESIDRSEIILITLSERFPAELLQVKDIFYSRSSLLSSGRGRALKASLVGAKKVSAPCWFSSSVIPAVWIAPTRRLRRHKVCLFLTPLVNRGVGASDHISSC